MARDDRLPLPRLAARARLVVKASLGWLGGRPRRVVSGGVLWAPVRGEDVVLGARELRRASRALTELRTELREALRELVPEPERWLEAVAVLLSRLGLTVHQRAPLAAAAWTTANADAAEELAREQPALRRLLAAASWAVAPTPWQERRALGWIERHAGSLAGWLGGRGDDHDVDVALALLRAGLDGDRRSATTLVELLAEPRWGVAVSRGPALAYLNRLVAHARAKRWRTLQPADLPEPPSAEAIPLLAAFAAEWAGWDRRRRRRAASLLEIASPVAALPAWERWWTKIARDARRLAGLARTAHRKDVPPALVELGRRLESRLPTATRDRLPPDLDVERWLDAVRRLSAAEQAPLAEAATRTLRRLPAVARHAPARLAFLFQWADLSAYEAEERLVALVDGLRRHLERAGEAGLHPWSGQLDRARRGERFHWGLDRALIQQPAWARRPLGDPAVADAVAALAGLAPAAAELAFGAVLAGAGGELARAFVLALPPDRRELKGYLLKAVAFAVGIAADGAQLAALVEHLDAVRVDEGDPILDAAEALARAGRRDLAAAAVLHEPAVVVDLGRRRRLLTSLEERSADPPPPQDGAAPWIDAQPPALWAALRRLAAVDPAAEETARRLLRRDVRERSSLERELAALAGRSGEGVARRRAALEARLAAPPELAPARLAKLVARLARAADRAWLERWREALTAELRPLLERRLQPAGPIDLLLGDDEIVLLDSILRFADVNKAFRRFGLELLARRCGPPPWDLRDHPANVAFRRRMERQGVDFGPWVDAPFRRRVVAADGRELDVALADDPLDVLRMGAPFGTCLSPWDFNFYSAVANAVDLNKRVAFGRDRDGRILGRCLLVLAEGPALVAFHAYCHERSVGFADLMAGFVAELGKAMGVAVRPSGVVAKLASPYWWDDGPRDLLGVHAFLADGSPFRTSLAALEPATLPAALRAACAPADVDSLALERLLDLPELEARPELVLPLAPLLDERRLTARDYLRAATLAWRAGDAELARAWLRRHAPAWFREPWDWQRIDPTALVELEPSLALRLLRRSHPRTAWRHYDPWVVRHAARAHELLRRPVQAAALYEMAGVAPPAQGR